MATSLLATVLFASGVLAQVNPPVELPFSVPDGRKPPATPWRTTAFA